MNTDERQIKDGSQGKAVEFEQELSEMQRIVDSYVRECHDWYQAKKKYPRRVFQTTGIIVIVLSAVITLLSSQEGPGYRVAVGILGVIITSATGVNTLLRSEKVWQTFAMAQFNLEYLLRKWELRIAEARSEIGTGRALEIARAATAQLLDEAKKIRGGETEDFFRTLAQRK